MHKTIYLQRSAPAKPAFAQPCNGCGVCCAAEPCPLGVIISLSRQGPCKALEWDESARRYQCGMMVHASHYLPFSPKRTDALLRRIAKRWIASGIGCDSDVETSDPP